MLAPLTDAIVAAFGSLTGVATCSAHPPLKGKLTLPAVGVWLDEIEPGTDPGTGELAVRARFRAVAVVDPIVPGAALAVRQLAAACALKLYESGDFGLKVTRAQLVRLGEEIATPALDGYLTWAVEWTHEFEIGTDVWAGGITPTEVWLGQEPDTGPAHVGNYEQVV